MAVADDTWQAEEAGALLHREALPERSPPLCKAAWALLWAASLLLAAFAGSALASSRASALPPTTGSPGSAGGVAAEVELVSTAPSLYGTYHSVLKSARYIDLTHAFSPDSPVWAGFGPAAVKGSVVGADMEGFAKTGESWSYRKHGFIATAYQLTTDQLGTQLDPPAHWNEYGATISDLPATIALRPLVVIDITPQVSKDPGYHATAEDVKAWEKSHHRIPEGSVVFFRSDWSKGWQNYTEKGETPATFPGVKLDTLKFLHLERKILFHGHEPLDTDMTASLEGEAWLMHNNFAQAEGVTNLDKVPTFGCLISIGFAKALGGSGGYARYVAICPAGSTSEGTTIEEDPGAPLPGQKHPLRRGANGVLRPDENAEATDYCSVETSLGCDTDSHKPVW